MRKRRATVLPLKHCAAAQTLRQQRLCFPIRASVQYHPSEIPVRLPEFRLPLLSATPHRSGYRGQRNSKRARNTLQSNAA